MFLLLYPPRHPTTLSSPLLRQFVKMCMCSWDNLWESEVALCGSLLNLDFAAERNDLSRAQLRRRRCVFSTIGCLCERREHSRTREQRASREQDQTVSHQRKKTLFSSDCCCPLLPTWPEPSSSSFHSQLLHFVPLLALFTRQNCRIV